MDPELKKLQAAYWTTRLEQTLSHTHEASKLIFTIDGGVLALVAFVLKTYPDDRSVRLVAVVPMAVLVAISLLHARLIYVQRAWYQGIDRKLQALLSVKPVDSSELEGSAHRLHGVIHLVVGLALLALTFALIHYANEKPKESTTTTTTSTAATAPPR